jgi:2-haloacid dehalogenase
MSSYQVLGAYPEAREALLRLRAAGLRLAILSNGAPAMLASAARSAGLDDVLEAILSVEDVGIYKPHPSVYRLAVDRLGVPAGEILFVSSNGWDAHGASAFGLRVAWCNRTGQPRERLPGAPDVEIRSLSELPELVGSR